ncbi:MAG: tyrosine-type recombinase/integrase, partial [Pseudonocardiaceae bacterium]
PNLDERWFQRTASAIAERNLVSLRGLGQRVVLEFVYGLQRRCAAGSKTALRAVRPLLDRARLVQVESLRELPVEGMSVPARALRNELVKLIERFETDPDTERVKDRWNLAAFGHAGSLRFGEISQAWLREATKVWAFDALPKVRGNRANNTVQSQINGIAELSRSLHLQRGDHGADPRAVGREDITAFCNRLAYLHDQGAIGSHSWRRSCVQVKRLLGRMRSLGLTRAGQPLHGLADEFALGREDIPDEPEAQEAGRDLPTEVIALLCSRLASLEARRCTEVRTAVELLIDTGRRPNEICSLKLDCLTRDQDGKPVLIYDNHKAFRLDRRLPIPEATAGVIQTQQQRVRTRFPDTPEEGLALLPAATRNPDGRRPMSERWLTTQHRRWVDGLPDLVAPIVVEVDGRTVTRTLPFDKTRIFPYAYRHTYAQRHADAGVPVDVLRDLMDHKELTTTQGYYKSRELHQMGEKPQVT